MPRKKLLASLIISSFALTACDSDEKVSNEQFAYSRLQFNPTAGELPKPNDLLFSGTPDGTLQLPDENTAIATAVNNGTAMSYADSTVALGALDGWSTTHPLVMDVDLIDGNTIVAAPGTGYLAPGAIRIFSVTLGGGLSTDSANCSLFPTQTICDVKSELTYGSDFVVKVTDDGANDGKGTIAVVWRKPLPETSSYLYAFTNNIKDSSGRVIRGSITYEYVKSNINTDPIGVDGSSTRNLQGLMNQYDYTLATHAVITNKMLPENTTFTGVFTTQSILNVIDTVKSTITASSVVLEIPTITTQTPPTTPLGAAEVYYSTATFPYYLSQTSADSYMSATGDSFVAISIATTDPDGAGPEVAPLTQAGLVGQLIACPTNTISNPASAVAALTGQDIRALIGCDIKFDTGDNIGKSIDGFNHLTRFNPLPMPIGVQDIEVQITIPGGGTPSGGYPVNISIHGLGTLKETTLASADAFAAAGIATIAIDMPLHGSRGFDFLNASGAPGAADGVYDISATDAAGAVLLENSGLPITAASYAKGNPLAFVNINSGLTVRDNFRQAIIDLLRLRAQLGNFKDPDNTSAPLFDTTKVTVHGLSLGAITAASFTTYANRFPSTTFNVASASLVAPTSGLAWAFAESPSFRPAVLDGLVGEVAKQQNVEKPTPGSSTYAEYLQIATDTLEPSLKFAIQTLVDPIDPINIASTLAVNTTNLHVIEIVGDGFDGDISTLTEEGLPAYDINATNKSDQTLPNFGAIPVTGTERLIANLGLPCLTTETTENRGAVRFKNGHHSSLINPVSAAGATTLQSGYATTEMQTQVATFAASGTIVIDNANDVISTTCPQL